MRDSLNIGPTPGEEPCDQSAAPKANVCPKCGHTLEALLFLGITPDGYVCETCQLYFNDDLQPLAHVIV